MHPLSSRMKDWFYPIITLITLLLLWQGLDVLLDIKEIILPNPLELVNAFYAHWQDLFKHTGVTMLESVLGFILGTSASLLFATLFVFSKTTKRCLYPYAIALKATPLYAFAPLLVIWFGSGMGSKIVMSAMVAFFPVLITALKGFSAVSQENLDVLRSSSATNRQIFFKLRVPTSLPYIFPSLKIATTLAVVGATIAEFTGATAGIGHLIVNASYYLETSLMFASIIMISLGGIVFFNVITLLEKKVVFWEEEK